MHHHDAREYGAAVDETAKRFQAELEETIDRSQASAGKLINRIASEIPKDSITSTRQLMVAADGVDGIHLDNVRVHEHALTQLAERAGIPALYVSRLKERGHFGNELLADNLNRLFFRDADKRLLIREVNGEIRGVLSDAYRRLDSRPIIEAFADACDSVGAVPVEGVGGDLRWEIKALLPMVFRPMVKEHEEVIAVGLSLSNSDFGCGALSMRMFSLRVWCTNYAKLEEGLRQVHLGKRLGDSIEYSAATHKLDTDTMVSATRDLVGGLLSPERVQQTVGLIGQAMEKQVDPKAFLAAQRGLTKDETGQVEEVLMGGVVRQLPAGSTAYRMSNALSWVAKSAERAERRLELEQLAGEILMKVAS